MYTEEEFTVFGPAPIKMASPEGGIVLLSCVVSRCLCEASGTLSVSCRR